MNTYAYIRVSTRDQNLDRQIVALKEYGREIDHIFSDKMSGKNFNRPSYQEMLQTINKGDLILIKSIDRLGRNYEDIMEQWKLITSRGVDIEVLDMPLLNTRSQIDGLTGAFISNLVLQVLSYVAQIERENIKQRQKEGISNALAKGVKFGRTSLDQSKIDEVKALTSQGHSINSACQSVGISRSAYYKYISVSPK